MWRCAFALNSALPRSMSTTLLLSRSAGDDIIHSSKNSLSHRPRSERQSHLGLMPIVLAQIFTSLKRLELLRPAIPSRLRRCRLRKRNPFGSGRRVRLQAGGRRHHRGVDQRGAHFERDPIPYALDMDWPVGAAGFEPLHLEIRSAELHPASTGSRHRSGAPLIRDAQVRVPPPGLRVLGKFRF